MARPSRDQCMWERLSSPIEAVFGASAHPPKRPYGLTRPAVPPDGSFVLVGISKHAHVAKLGLATYARELMVAAGWLHGYLA